MTVRVRFAPSPTGHLHIGGARTALYSYLYAKTQGGTYILRVEDTDQERSTKEFEESIISDLDWLGITSDEGPNNPGEYGPYRQSERLHLYKEHSDKLLSEGKAFYCFCSNEELTKKKELAMQEERAPHYDGTCRDVPLVKARERLAAGEEATVRFKVVQKPYYFDDKVRGKIEFPKDMVGDFVMLRSSGMPVYNYGCVIDDHLMNITHVIRAEDHIPNTLRQLMLYEALGAKAPKFAHVSLLIGQDRQKLSKRHGTTSVSIYRNESYLPGAMNNYLSLLGWSHPDEKDIFGLQELEKVFGLKRLSKASAMFDMEKFAWVNGQHLRNLELKSLKKLSKPFIKEDSLFHAQTSEWQDSFLNLYKEYVEFFKDFNDKVNEVFSSDIEMNEKLQDIYSWESSSLIKEYLVSELKKVQEAGDSFVSEETFKEWMNHIKKEMKIKGKKLFMGARGVLTGHDHGPDLNTLIPMTPIETLIKRINSI
jgi:glutamyl-tRNA synthetase